MISYRIWGVIEYYRKPVGLGVRVDDGYVEGMPIALEYDSMIAKLIVHGFDREDATAKMIQAIDDYKINGFATTLGFCKFALRHPEFVDGSFTINFVAEHYNLDKLNVFPFRRSDWKRRV